MPSDKVWTLGQGLVLQQVPASAPRLRAAVEGCPATRHSEQGWGEAYQDQQGQGQVLVPLRDSEARQELNYQNSLAIVKWRQP